LINDVIVMEVNLNLTVIALAGLFAATVLALVCLFQRGPRQKRRDREIEQARFELPDVARWPANRNGVCRHD